MNRWLAWRAPTGLYGLALVLGAIAASRVTFPPTEVSAYVLGVARNLVEGRGLVSDAVWSYASGPYILPRPAFDIWQPLPGLLAALPMAVAGTTFAAAQASSVLLGAGLAPLTWWIAHDAAARNGLAGARATVVAVGAGLVAALFGPFLTAMAGPDSFVPFTVFVVGACALMPRALQGGRWAGVGLGLALGLAYLSRQEALWFGLAYLVLALESRRTAVAALRWPMLAGAIVAVPWIVRDALTFGGGGLGQTLENAWMTTNTDIFAFGQRPSLATFLAQGPATILGHIAGGVTHDVVDVILLPTAPVGLIGLVALVVLWRTPVLHVRSPLRALLAGGGITFAVSSVVFPVATAWGTFQHAAGPLLVALIVAAALGLDALVARVRAWRGWSRENAWLAPLAILALSVPVAALSVALLAGGATAEAARMADLRAALPALDGPVVTDHPMWVSMTLDLPALARPAEDAASVSRLAATFGAHWLLWLDDAAGPPPAGACFDEVALPATAGGRLFRVAAGCQP